MDGIKQVLGRKYSADSSGFRTFGFTKFRKRNHITVSASVGLAHRVGGTSGVGEELSKLCQYEKLNEALHVVEYMHQQGGPISKDVICSLLQLCTIKKDLAACRRLHFLIFSNGLDSISFLSNSLIRLFSACGSLIEAKQVFEKVVKSDVYTWNAIISAHIKLGEAANALNLYHEMQHDGIKPNKVTYLCILKACGHAGAIKDGRQIHDRIIIDGFDSNMAVGNTLVDMYAKCGCLEEAWKVFNEMPSPDVVSWAAIIAGYVQHGHYVSALKLYWKMQQDGIKPDRVVFLSILRACGSMQAVEQGRLIHGQIIQKGLEMNIVIGNSLVDMYAKCGSLDEACKVFDRLPNKDIVTWSAMIACYAQHGHGLSALRLYENMQQVGIKPDKVVFLSVLKACGSIGAIEQGVLIHNQIKKSGFTSDVTVGNSLVDMYAKCGNVQEARKLFDSLPNRDVVSWGAMLSGYVQHGHHFHAFELYEKMHQEGNEPSVVVFSCMLKMIGNIGAIEQGKVIHDQIIKSGFDSHLVIGNSLIDMYAKCGSLPDARKVFDQMPSTDLVSWGAMITGYTQHGESILALELYEEMQQKGLKLDKVIYSCILKASGSVGAINQGRRIHELAIEYGIDSDLVVGNALIDMYAKCGSLDEACKVFNKLSVRDAVSWDAIIKGYAQYGNYMQARHYLEDMKQQGASPDEIIFLSLLTAYGHAGLLEEGYQYFKSMIYDHGIIPTMKHYNCMIDLFGRSGCLNEAEELLKMMPVPPDITGWTAVLTGCRTYGNLELGQRCFDQIVQLDQSNSSAYVLMSNIYADANLCTDANKLQMQRNSASAWKKPGKAWIEVNNKIHEFVVGSKSHPQSDKIYAKLKKLNRLMTDEGYVPHLNLVLESISEQKKENLLCGHCEKLAIAFGLVSTPDGTTIRITKNLRVCTDCHNASKIISKIERREVIIRDGYRVHHMKDGMCSCGDYY